MNMRLVNDHEVLLSSWSFIELLGKSRYNPCCGTVLLSMCKFVSGQFLCESSNFIFRLHMYIDSLEQRTVYIVYTLKGFYNIKMTFVHCSSFFWNDMRLSGIMIGIKISV